MYEKSQVKKELTTEKVCGTLYIALSKKQSRVSTLTIAQSGDYWSDIDVGTAGSFPEQFY